jgi:hypothetical protein
MSFAPARALYAFLALAAVGACAQLDRLPAVAVADADRTSIAGIADARFMASDTAALTAFGRRIFRESKYFAWRTLPRNTCSRIRRRRQWRVWRRRAGGMVGKSPAAILKIVTGVSTGRSSPTRLSGQFDPLLAAMYDN